MKYANKNEEFRFYSNQFIIPPPPPPPTPPHSHTAQSSLDIANKYL